MLVIETFQQLLRSLEILGPSRRSTNLVMYCVVCANCTVHFLSGQHINGIHCILIIGSSQLVPICVKEHLQIDPYSTVGLYK